MALVLTNPTLSTTSDKTEIEANFTDVVNYINGDIDNASLSAAAGIALSKLAASYQEVWLTLRYSAVLFGAWPAAPADPTAPTVTELIDYVPLPGSDADTAWVATDVSWVCNDTGTADASFDIRYGAYDGAGVMAGAGSVITGAAVTAIAVDKGNEGRALEGGSVTLTQSTTVRGLYLVSAGQGTSAMDDTTAPGSWLTVTVALRRQIQA